MTVTYRKHNSFIEIRQQGWRTGSDVLQRLVTVCGRKELTDRLSQSQQRVLSSALAELREPSEVVGMPRFRLSPNVIHEISTLPDEVLPRYLVHRYRYEMFPYLHIVDEYPPYLQIEPTSLCNYRCVFCYETDPTFTKKSNGYMGHMSLDLFKHVVDQAAGNVEFVSLASRGEPLLCRDIEQMLAYTRDKFINLKMNTNASLLDERKCHAILQSGVKTLVISADAAEESLYSRLRVGGKLKKVLHNVERLRTIKETQYKNSSIIMRVSGVKFLEEQNIDSMVKLWGELVDQVVFVAYNPWENTYNKVSNHIEAPCSDLWRRMFVWWDGRINPCDVDYKSTLAIGSLNSASLTGLWTSEAYGRLRANHMEHGRGMVEPCRRCAVI